MWNVEIENIGGIRSGETTLTRGPNIVQASNFEGKSSLLYAIQTVIGTTGQFGETHPLTEGADDGHVTLETDDDTFTATLESSTGPSGRVVSRSGNTYLTEEQDRVTARLFAFLGEDNPIRAAVRNKDKERLTELLKRPLETENIDARLNSLRSDVAELETEQRQADRAKENLPAAQEEVTQLEKKLKELRERRDELEEKVDEDTEQRDLRNKLASKRSDLDQKKKKLERLNKQIGRRENKLEKKRKELDELEIPDELDVDTDISEKQDRVEELELKIDLLGDLYRSNRAILDENEVALIADVERSLSGDAFGCFVCGQDTTEEEVIERLDDIREKQKELETEKDGLGSEIDEIQERKEEIRTNRTKKERLEEEIKRLELDIKEDRREIDSLKEKIEDLEADAEELEGKYEQFEEEQEEYSSELKTVQQEILTKESDLGQAEGKLERLEEEAGELEELEAELEEKRSKIKDLNARKHEMYSELGEQFGDAMDDILATFDPGFDGAYLDVKKNQDESYEFEVNLARDTRTADLNNLSEGERELVGIVTALAGYRTFSVDERVPCILLDGISQLAAEHIRHMIGYLKNSTEILVTTAYPEAGSFDGQTISPDNWEVVSNEEGAAS